MLDVYLVTHVRKYVLKLSTLTEAILYSCNKYEGASALNE